MLGAGLLAKKAVEKGLKVAPYIKTSLSPGSGVVTYYLESSGVIPYLEELGYGIVGYGCMTCIGNSGPLPEPVSQAIEQVRVISCIVACRMRAEKLTKLTCTILRILISNWNHVDVLCLLVFPQRLLEVVRFLSRGRAPRPPPRRLPKIILEIVDTLSGNLFPNILVSMIKLVTD